MNKAIILHGTCTYEEYFSEQYPSLSNSHWLPWLQKQLLIKGVHAITPEIPEAYKLDYQSWVHEIERFEIGPDTILVGHSCGGGFWVRWLSEHPHVKVGRVVLVAPWLDPTNSKQSNFFEFQIEPNIALQTGGLTIFESDDDMETVRDSISSLRTTLADAEYRTFHKYGHFTHGDMKSEAFPELLEAVCQ